MHRETAARRLVLALAAIAMTGAKPVGVSVPPGSQLLLTIDGSNTVTFLPETGLTPARVDYQARVEYIVNTRVGEEPEPEPARAAKRKANRKSADAARNAKPGETGPVPSKSGGIVDMSLHSVSMKSRQKGQVVYDAKMSRERFLGKMGVNAPLLRVSYHEAPPAVQSMLKTFDAPSASLLLDVEGHVVKRRGRGDGFLQPVVETILSVHAPVPANVDSWDAPVQLAMGQGQTAKGSLHFKKVKTAPVGGEKDLKVNVSGVLKAEGALVGNFIKNGTYTVAGEQFYDIGAREWKSASWTVAIEYEMANEAGVTVAHGQGKMVIDSRTLKAATAPVPSK